MILAWFHLSCWCLKRQVKLYKSGWFSLHFVDKIIGWLFLLSAVVVVTLVFLFAGGGIVKDRASGDGKGWFGK